MSTIVVKRTAGPAIPVDPPFLHHHVDDYYDRRLRREWGGKNPVMHARASDNAIRLNTNDYLCLAGDRRIIDAEIEGLDTYGHGETISRVFTHHHSDIYRSFEARIAALTGAEDAVLWSSGYVANVGLIQSLAAPDTPVYIDMKAHMSLWEGVSSAKAVARPFRHNDPEHLDRLITQFGPGLVVIDTVYSTDGAVARLRDFAELANYHGCVLIVDETHSFGTHGHDGAGMVKEAGLESLVHFRSIGMSKAVAARGGVVVCSRRNAEFLRYQAFPLIFSTGVLPHEIAGFNAALDIFRDDPWRREQLHANHAHLRAGLAASGYNVEISGSLIVALEPGEVKALITLRDALERRGVFGSSFLPPATPNKRCILRLSLNCNLTRADLDRVIEACRDCRDEVDFAAWRSTKRLQVPRKTNGIEKQNIRGPAISLPIAADRSL